MNRFLAVLVLALLLAAIPGSAQNRNKGLSKSKLEPVTTMRESGTPYESSRHNCYAIAVSATGPFIDSTLNTLSFPDNDCREFFNAVNEQFRFQYRIRQFDLLDLENSRRVYRQAADLLARVQKEPVQEGDVVLMYFSGHGLTIDGRYCFPLSDADVGAVQRMLSGAEILSAAENFANRGANVLLFLDTCEAGSIGNEKLNLTGAGGVACFPASSAVTSTQERLAIGSSVFGERLTGILSGEFKGGGDDALTVSAVGRSLTPVLIGEVSPKYFDSGKSDVGNAVLVDNLAAITEYNRSLSTYNEYIRKGQQAVSQKRFHEALAFYGSADALGKSMYQEDVLLLQSVIRDLNQQIRNACQEPAGSDVWRFLSSIDTGNPLLDLSGNDLVSLFMGCGAYYKSQKDLDNAYRFFQNAEKQGDKKNAPYELYLVSAGGNVPSYRPVTEDEREILLMTAAKNNNKAAKKQLDQDGVLKDLFKRIQYSFIGEDPVYAFAITSDLSKSLFPVGERVDCFWGSMHIGADIAFGPSLRDKTEPSTNLETRVFDGILVPEIGLAGTAKSEQMGSFSYTVTPGFFYKFISLDLGLGQMWTRQFNEDVYFDAYSYNHAAEEGKTSTLIDMRFEKTVLKNSYFIIKPGVTLILPLDWIDSLDFYFGARYRICPKEKSLNAFECSVGFSFPI